MALTDDQSDAIISDSESISPPDSPKLSAARSESPPGLVEDMRAYDFNVRHTCKGRKITSWPPLSRRISRNHKAGKKCPDDCTYPVNDCPLASKLRKEAAERKKNCEACSLGI
ncbi:hypothetical protein BGAL_0275g00100 [Botrytis galanthina]|uniref:Uncharacterized protein n=1 Tax=Botrytis galanthina TaxID=278940 RepID=A0A4V4HU44_9HELO|nr:hypothetical protein BGAL_0275g00100 [Botrytis galanthina]